MPHHPAATRLRVEPCEDRLALSYDFTAVTQMIQGALAGEGVGTPIGGAVLRVMQHNEVIYEQAFGNKTLASVVPTASAGKNVSAAVLLSLVDDGLLTLDSRAASYYPEFAAPGKADITLRQLFSHTSGLPQDSAFLNSGTITLQQAVRNIGASEPLTYGPPGSTFAYGGVSMHVAGGMAELAAGGTPFEQLFQARVADPLGMTTMTYGATPNPRIGGGQRTNAADYARFMQMVLDSGRYDGRQVLSPLAIDTMVHDQRNGATVVQTPNPGVPYGFGTWLDRREADGDPIQVGAYGAFGFSAWADYSRELVAVFLVQDSYQNVRNLVGALQAELRAQVPEVAAAVTVTVNQAAGQAHPAPGGPVRFAVRFSQPVTGFTAADVVIGGTAPGALTATVTGGGADYEVTVTGWTGPGTVTLRVPAGVAFDAAGRDNAWSDSTDNAVAVAAPAAPRVAGVAANPGAAQRSRVRSIAVTFDTAVTFAGPVAGAFTLSRVGGGRVGGFTASAAVVGGRTVVTLSGFTGPETEFGSLADGRYVVTVGADRVSAGGRQLDGNGDGTGGDNFGLTGTVANGLYRLFGDGDGDGDVDRTDQTAFQAAMGTYNATFDFDGDGSVGAADRTAFRRRLGTAIM